jgi:tetratricopeptide (TPR) repeat protein
VAYLFAASYVNDSRDPDLEVIVDGFGLQSSRYPALTDKMLLQRILLEQAQQHLSVAVGAQPSRSGGSPASGPILEAARKNLDLTRLRLESIPAAPTADLTADDAARFNERGVQFLHGGAFTEAASAFTQAINLAPTVAGYYVNRGDAFNRSRQYGRAIADYDNALKLDGALWQAYMHRGIAYFEMGRFEEARAQATLAIERNGKFGRGVRQPGERAVSDEEALGGIRRLHAGDIAGLSVCTWISGKRQCARRAKSSRRGLRELAKSVPARCVQ